VTVFECHIIKIPSIGEPDIMDDQGNPPSRVHYFEVQPQRGDYIRGMGTVVGFSHISGEPRLTRKRTTRPIMWVKEGKYPDHGIEW
jgi:hypothetical protein